MTDSKPFADKLALVTGASRGIGAATAEALARAGAHVILVARTAKALEEVEERIHEAGGSATIDEDVDIFETRLRDARVDRALALATVCLAMVALLVFTKKLACTGDTVTLPIRCPFKPDASIKRPA